MEQENREAIIRIEGKLELLDEKLTNLRDNHIFHFNAIILIRKHLYYL